MRGAVTCEQAYELVVQLLASDPQPVLPTDLVRLRQQLRSYSRSASRPLDQPAGPACALLSGLFPSSRMPRPPLALRIMLVDLGSRHT